ncbi:trehalase family glycosidase [Paenibacillus sp. J5C_2022]|uniref:amylo-alpha-1,6-glucosidase n=1 Tax=Paenibacillus sp. J5C2022 TaxID=2977129 RepID=UPI0021D3A7D3|nr:glycogen debranching N-terminal domain-containing protein [Paenibacillus sp. J5C2022]MCU6708740.1 trehalase family glycosidase [Paenibacillus sp. J5C2022]
MLFTSLKQGHVYSVTNEYGNMEEQSIGCGLYMYDTRFLKSYALTINGVRPIYLAQQLKSGVEQRIKLSNGDIRKEDAMYEKMDLELNRSQFIHDGRMHDRIDVKNGSQKRIRVTVELEIAPAFDDLFEVRGAKRPARGTDSPTQVDDCTLVFGYEGLDGIARSLHIHSSMSGMASADGFSYELDLSPGQSQRIDLSLVPVVGSLLANTEPLPYEEARDEAFEAFERWTRSMASVLTDDDAVNRTLEQSMTDLYALSTDIGDGVIPVAGIPWFCVPFGRDSIITAYQTLMFYPEFAKNTLRTLARLQGVSDNPWSDENPGKILHEMRSGEMANLDEIPFKRYYGSIDSTPLFLILLSETFHWSGDKEFLNEMLPSAEKALAYLEKHGDLDGDGFIEFHKESEGGLNVQSWKDSNHSMVHKDGTHSHSPMAVVEVQGYLYDAKTRMASIYRQLGETGKAERLEEEAAKLKKHFNDAFWMADAAFYALALDKDKRQVQTVTSDPGHALWSGIIDESRSQAVVDTLLSDGLFSGWGIRTMSKDEKAYSPTAYHNGTVWPHDNSLIALGMARYGYAEQTAKLARALFDSAEQFGQHRLPELFCGYDRNEEQMVPFPVACSPQAWAAGTPYGTMLALLNPQANGWEKTMVVNPTLPSGLNRLRISNWRLGEGEIDFALERSEGGEGFDLTIERNTSGYRIEQRSEER